MIRPSVCLVVVALVLVAGCTKKDEAAQAGAAPAAAGEPAAPKTAGGKTINWEKIQRVPFARMQALLPDTVLGFKRSDLRGSTNPDGERTYSEAAADYKGPGDTELRLLIQDHPVQAGENVSSKTTSFKSFPVTKEEENSDESRFHIVVGDRFIVEAYGQKLKVAQLKVALEKVDLAKLAMWKLEGVK